MNYYKRHLGDYAKDTGHLSALEHGVYTLLLDWYYASERPIPVSKAYRIAKASAAHERAAVDSVLADFFTRDNDCWRSKRVDSELVLMQSAADRSRSAGLSGGRPRKTQKVPTENPSGFQEKPDGLSPETLAISHKPLAINQKDQELPPTAGEKPPVQPEPPDPIFGTGLAMLKRKGVPEKPARSFLGKFRRDVGDDLRASALLARAEADDVSEPLAWLAAAAKACRRSTQKPLIAQTFADKTYTGTPDDELPDYLKP